MMCVDRPGILYTQFSIDIYLLKKKNNNKKEREKMSHRHASATTGRTEFLPVRDSATRVRPFDIVDWWPKEWTFQTRTWIFDFSEICYIFIQRILFYYFFCRM